MEINVFDFYQLFSQPVPVANRSIEISSPRLHYGRAAVYGSTIVPLRIVALHGCRPYISAHVLIGRQTDSRSSAKGCTGLDGMKFSRYTAIVCLSLYKHVFNDSKSFTFQKIFQKIFCPRISPGAVLLNHKLMDIQSDMYLQVLMQFRVENAIYTSIFSDQRSVHFQDSLQI